jgi:hypothetical protein
MSWEEGDSQIYYRSSMRRYGTRGSLKEAELEDSDVDVWRPVEREMRMRTTREKMAGC